MRAFRALDCHCVTSVTLQPASMQHICTLGRGLVRSANLPRCRNLCAPRPAPKMQNARFHHAPADSAVDTLAAQLPDLVLSMRRDGAILRYFGGAALPGLVTAHAHGEPELDVAADSQAFIRQTLKRALADRRSMNVAFEHGERTLSLRVTPQGPDRAMVVIGVADAARRDSDTLFEQTRLDRRGFKRRLKESVAVAALREQPLAVAVVQLDGLPDIAAIIAKRVSEQLLEMALSRLSAQLGDGANAAPRWQLGMLGESTLGLILESADRDVVTNCIEGIRANLREPLESGGAAFQLTAHVGVAVLNTGASIAAKELLEQAQLAASEARQWATDKIVFFGDTLRLRSVARLDLGRELREAIDSRQVGVRYVGRFELATGRLVARLGYLRWTHPLRGELRPHEFLRIAGSTGLGVQLSRVALAAACEDFAEQGASNDPGVRVSFGPLREHVLHEDFVGDIERVLDAGAIPAERLEIRIAERIIVSHDIGALRPLQRRGVQIIVDEAGRSASALTALARAPIAAIQVDRAFVADACTDPQAAKICRATFGIAAAFGLSAFATGIDTAAHRDAMASLDCEAGSGDFFA